MILPIIAATTRDLLRQVPRATVEGALALGMTDSEALGAVTVPWVRSGVIGAWCSVWGVPWGRRSRCSWCAVRSPAPRSTRSTAP